MLLALSFTGYIDMGEIVKFVGNAFQSIFEFFEIVIQCLLLIVDFFQNISEMIGMVLSLPTTALETIFNLVHYWPSYIWLPIISLLTLVVTFRVLKIVMSGG